MKEKPHSTASSLANSRVIRSFHSLLTIFSPIGSPLLLTPHGKVVDGSRPTLVNADQNIGCRYGSSMALLCLVMVSFRSFCGSHSFFSNASEAQLGTSST